MESRWGRDFPHLSRPALGPTKPHVHCVPGLFLGTKAAGAFTIHSSPSAKAKERVQPYLYSPPVRSMNFTVYCILYYRKYVKILYVCKIRFSSKSVSVLNSVSALCVPYRFITVPCLLLTAYKNPSVVSVLRKTFFLTTPADLISGFYISSVQFSVCLSQLRTFGVLF